MVGFFLVTATPSIASEIALCDALAREELAINYVSSRYCGTPFDDAKVEYLSDEVRDLMAELRSPVVPGHFMLNADAMILADQMSLVERKVDSRGSRFVFSYRRLATMEGSGNFRVFVGDPNPADRFQIEVDGKCMILDPPLARVHPGRLHRELIEIYDSMKKSLGGSCELSHCLALKKQIDSLLSRWAQELEEPCDDIAIKSG